MCFSEFLYNYSVLANFFSCANGYTTSDSIIVGATRHFIDYGHGEGRTFVDSSSTGSGVTETTVATEVAESTEVVEVESTATATPVISSSSPSSITSDAEALAYIASHEDLMNFFGTDTAGAIKHYNDFGKAEGRTITFDASQYLSNYSDLANFFSSANGYTTSDSIIVGACIVYKSQRPREQRAYGDAS